MDRFALLVDAGYFYAAGSDAAFGEPVARRELRLADPEKAVRELQQQASKLCGDLQLLRVYWYDAMPGPVLSPEQSELALQSGLKLRLGVLNNQKQQKGVDSLIVTDLIDLARNNAITDAVLISGDEDIRLGVELAQSFGLRVHLWGAGNTDHNVSRSLRMEADSFHAIPGDWFTETLERPSVGPPADAVGAVQPAVAADDIDEASLVSAADGVARALLSRLDLRSLQQLVASVEVNKQVPSEYDRRLIATTATRLGGPRFQQPQMRTIRGVFITVLRELTEYAEPDNPETPIASC